MLPAWAGLPCNSQAPCPPRDWLPLPETTPGPVPPSPSPGGPRGRTLRAATADGDDTTRAATKTTGEVSLRAARPYFILSESILKGVNPGKVSSYFAHTLRIAVLRFAARRGLLLKRAQATDVLGRGFIV